MSDGAAPDVLMALGMFLLTVLVAVVGWLARAVARLDRTVAGLAHRDAVVAELSTRLRLLELSHAALGAAVPEGD